MKKSNVLLDLEGAIGDDLLDKDLRDGLSAATRTGDYLWVAGDEQVSIQRLEKTEEGTYGNCVCFKITDYIDLITNEDEIDIEGMDFDGRYLWIIGSHSYKRSKMKPDTDDPEKEIKKLTKVSLDPNRILLARIPCVSNEHGEYVLCKECPDPDNADETITASKLKHGKKKSQLSKLLKQDEHLKKFVKIPGKENGLDIEGLAAIEDRLFIGLRGPVLRGWAILLEVKLRLTKKNKLELEAIGDKKEYYRKFFVDLYGMGIRELATDGHDLLILAGPTMDIDGSMAVYRWSNALKPHEDSLIAQDEIQEIISIPYTSKQHGIEKAEGMVMLEDGSVLVLYDSPGKHRTKGDHAVKADVFHLEKDQLKEEQE